MRTVFRIVSSIILHKIGVQPERHIMFEHPEANETEEQKINQLPNQTPLVDNVSPEQAKIKKKTQTHLQSTHPSSTRYLLHPRRIPLHLISSAMSEDLDTVVIYRLFQLFQ